MLRILDTHEISVVEVMFTRLLTSIDCRVNEACSQFSMMCMLQILQNNGYSTHMSNNLYTRSTCTV